MPDSSVILTQQGPTCWRFRSLPKQGHQRRARLSNIWACGIQFSFKLPHLLNHLTTLTLCLLFVYLKQDLSCIWSSPTDYARRLVTSRNPPVFPELRLQTHVSMPGFSHGCWGSNLGPHACKTSPSPIVPSPSFWVLIWLLVILKSCYTESSKSTVKETKQDTL